MNSSLVEYLYYSDEFVDLEEYESKSSISELTARQPSSHSNREGAPSSASSQLATVIANFPPHHWTAKDVLTIEPDPVAECRFLEFPVVKVDDNECILKARASKQVNFAFENETEEEPPYKAVQTTSPGPIYSAFQHCAASGDAPVPSGELKSAVRSHELADHMNPSSRFRVLGHLRRLNCVRRRKKAE